MATVTWYVWKVPINLNEIIKTKILSRKTKDVGNINGIFNKRKLPMTASNGNGIEPANINCKLQIVLFAQEGLFSLSAPQKKCFSSIQK